VSNFKQQVKDSVSFVYTDENNFTHHWGFNNKVDALKWLKKQKITKENYNKILKQINE